MIKTTTLEHLSVELVHEIFIYFQFHEVFNTFSNLNSRFAAIVSDILSLIPVYLGLNGISIAVTEFYFTHLTQSRICSRLMSLCVSDTLAIDNGLWLATHLSTFIRLRHLSLIDIKRSSFELMLNTTLPNTSLVLFSIRYTEYYRAVYTFEGVPEGTYYERIFHLFPSLRKCYFRFEHDNYNIIDHQITLPFGKTFMPIQTSLLKLQSIVLRHCSLGFLSHLLEHLPQLQDLSLEISTPWLPGKHPLRRDDKK
ncbi:unnamed protein product [Rotaria sp. Silwood2]|nr:unnamed protein product [Rotaria sp. Silwood2]